MLYLMAFLVGGLFSVLGQILLDVVRLTPAHTTVTLVVLGAVLAGLGLYEPLLQFAGAGASVPVSSFGYSLVRGALDEVERYGIVGVITGMFEITSAGISSAILFSFLAALGFARGKRGKSPCLERMKFVLAYLGRLALFEEEKRKGGSSTPWESTRRPFGVASFAFARGSLSLRRFSRALVQTKRRPRVRMAKSGRAMSAASYPGHHGAQPVRYCAGSRVNPSPFAGASGSTEGPSSPADRFATRVGG
ncbi:MAG: stage V sporulation protein AE [Brockia lithotrophica]|nr:stage V sporulation protein AE [Brockia lithotrophica]